MLEDNNIVFVINQPLEFLYAIFTVAEEKEFVDDCTQLKIEIDKELSDTIDNMKKSVSRFLKGELKYFFDYSSDVYGGIGYILYWGFFNSHSYISSVREIIENIGATNEIELLSNVVKFIAEINSNKFINEICNWDNVKSDNVKMLEIIENTNIENTNFKEILIEGLQNPVEIKHRFYLMLQQFYEKSYKPIESRVIEYLKPYKEIYENLFYNNPEKFARQFLHTTSDKLTLKTRIHISYFKYHCYHSWANYEYNEVWWVLGSFSEKISGDEKQKEKITLFYKALSDKKRIDIIDLLASRSWYVYELAEKLNMNSATISYHLGTLLSFDIVKFERSDHRVYYSLNKYKLKELSEDAIKNLLHEL